MSPSCLPYIGDELDVFFHARRWKAYWGARIRPWIAGDVLEVGAGIGANTMLLQTPKVRSWHCLEPDERLAERLRDAVSSLPYCLTTTGTTKSLSGERYDAILYIDVLEHIADDRSELARAASLLRAGGRLIVLSPAHQFLYSQFDKAIGHYRRYDKKRLLEIAPARLETESLAYLDSVGASTSLVNRMFLRQRLPSLGQILFWDRCLIPMSRLLDPLLGYRLGKSILGVWKQV